MDDALAGLVGDFHQLGIFQVLSEGTTEVGRFWEALKF